MSFVWFGEIFMHALFFDMLPRILYFSRKVEYTTTLSLWGGTNIICRQTDVIKIFVKMSEAFPIDNFFLLSYTEMPAPVNLLKEENTHISQI